ncbi:hypothetical protein ABUL39_04750 [Rhodothermus marinus]|uniref:hypothetical protein n=1 Tax=Rhodothermus marinus TaxID=29549 RepID=UPI0037C60D9A
MLRKRLALLLILALVSSVTVAQNWQVEVNGTRRDIAVKEIDSLVYVEVAKLGAAVGLSVEVDERNHIVKIERPGLVDYSHPAEEGETYELHRPDGTPFTFTYLGHTYHPTRCLTTEDNQKISRCGKDKIPVSMMLIRFRIGNPGSRPMTINRSFLDFYVIDENQHTTRELNFWFTADTRRAQLPVLLPGQSVELFSVVDKSEDPEPIRLVIEYDPDEQALEFPLNGYSSGPAAPQPGDIRVVVTGFEVLNATEDDPLNLDGCGDEVFVHAGVWIFRKNKDITGGHDYSRAYDDFYFFEKAYQQRTPVIGDVNGHPHRIKGGSGNFTACPSLSPADGGFLNGDKFPMPNPREIHGTPLRTKLPMLIYQGPITDDMLIAILPTIWEWGGDASLYNKASNWVLHFPRQRELAREVRWVSIPNEKDYVDLIILAHQDNAINGKAYILGDARSDYYYAGAPDRPIGSHSSRCTPEAYLICGSFYRYWSHISVLTAENVQKILNRGGLITYEYARIDPDSPDGYEERYLLHLRVEQF